MADVRSYCVLTKVPQALRVDYAYRCLGKLPRKVWLSKRAAFERANPNEEVTLDIMNELMQSVYDSQDRATTARNKLDIVYQGNEPLSKYVERITTLFGEVEAHETLSMGEKLHRFKKGLREELQDKAIIDPGTGLPYDDLDVMINALTKYEAAMGGGQRHYKRTRMGAPSGQAAALQPPQGQGQGLGQWEWQQPLLWQPPALQEQAGVAGMAGLAAGPAWGGAPPFVPYPHRRDGAAPHLRVDTRVAIPPDRRCHACHCRGHEFHMCPFRKLQNNIPLTSFDQLTIELCLQQCAMENRLPPHIYMTQGRGRGAIHGLPAPQALPAGAGMVQGYGQGRGRGRGWGWGIGRGRGRGGGGRRGRGRY
jgi:hypothetical protein